MTDRATESMCGRVGVVAIVNETPREWVDSLRTLTELAAAEMAELRVCALDVTGMKKVLEGSSIVIASEWNLSDAVAKFLAESPDLEALLIVTAPISVPKAMLERGLAWVRADPRVATVSFLSNSAGYFSFPYRNTPTPYPMVGHDETSVTALLRTIAPDDGPVPVCMPAGAAVLVNRAVLATVGGFDPLRNPNPREAIAELALRASRRGFQHRLDTGTYVTAQWFEGFPAVEASEDQAARHRLHQADPSFPALYDDHRHAGDAPAALAMDVARSKVLGLRLLIDGSCLGPMEMGTQVQTVELVRALLRRPEVASLSLAVPFARLPDYASDLLANGKVRLYDCNDLLFSGAEEVDILHRPFQPDRHIPWERWQGIAKRVVVTLQDLIAYRIGSYHPGGEAWLSYRRNIAVACAKADAVVAISKDTSASIVEERFNIASDQIYVVKNGSDHLNGSTEEETPLPLVERGMVASNFILILGATYAHKNRDVAIRIWQELRRRGHQIALIMAGAIVPKGSSRVEETIARRDGDDLLLTMPDVSSGVRTWLLRHASVVLYPTSAEGFGLVPFEAATLGTPTAHVSFGPLRELIDDPELPRAWSVEGLADFTERLLTDSAAAERNVSGILRSGSALTWDQTAEDLVATYYNVLARAARR
ncbi:glycosyltransferase [Rhodanobacter sp. 115]|nr:glycosyltransferase [Rhodanobacter sp. 115]